MLGSAGHQRAACWLSWRHLRRAGCRATCSPGSTGACSGKAINRAFDPMGPRRRQPERGRQGRTARADVVVEVGENPMDGVRTKGRSGGAIGCKSRQVRSTSAGEGACGSVTSGNRFGGDRVRQARRRIAQLFQGGEPLPAYDKERQCRTANGRRAADTEGLPGSTSRNLPQQWQETATGRKTPRITHGGPRVSPLAMRFFG